MNRIGLKRIGWTLALLASAAGTLTVVPARAQNVIEGAQPPARTIYVFNAGGQPKAKLGSWGNGQVTNGREWTYNGDSVLKIHPRNFYEGARFDLLEPIDLAPYKKDGFLRFRLRFKEVTGMRGGFGGPGGPGGGPPGALPPEFGQPAGGGPAPDAGADDGGDAGDGGDATLLNELATTRRNAQFGALPAPNAPRPGGPGMPRLGGGQVPGLDGGATGEPAPPPEQRTDITRLRVTFLHEQGATTASIPLDLNALSPDDDGWRTLFFPVRDMRSTIDVSGPVRRIILSADKDDTFWMAQFAIVIESSKMRVSIRRPSDEVGAQIADITVKPGPLSLVADVESGIADPIIEWNFDADVVGNLPPGALSMPVPAATPDAPVEGDVAPAAPVGPRIDARGLQARFTYPNEEQNYRVEVTVRDRSGQKTPVKASILVRVRG